LLTTLKSSPIAAVLLIISLSERSNKRSLDKSVQCPPRGKFKELSQEEAEKYKPWPLLSRQEKNHSEVKKESWVMNNFRFLQKHVSQCDLENINKDPNNYDLFGAVCQLCCVRLPAASEVFKHLALESHQNKVLLECQITGSEFNEYFNRLKNVRLKAV
uniref:C2H2-type domain-containing protein n=1 Tax=Haemonchus placei TaxID=6290 RepID=A0A158QMT7_HAEPC